MQLKVEVWKSDQNQEEIHLFLPNERNEYLLGFNPKLIAIEDVETFLAERGYWFERP